MRPGPRLGAGRLKTALVGRANLLSQLRRLHVGPGPSVRVAEEHMAIFVVAGGSRWRLSGVLGVAAIASRRKTPTRTIPKSGAASRKVSQPD